MKIYKTIIMFIIVLSLLIFNAQAAVQDSYFIDLDGYDWAAPHIKTMFIKNIVKGVGDGKFAPELPAKEIETIIMILRIMGYEDSLSNNSLSKYNFNQWMIPYIATALEKGIIQENELSSFVPGNPSSREITALYIVRALGSDFVEEAQENIYTPIGYDDEDKISSNLKGYVYLVKKLGLMTGYDGKFHPDKSITRAETAVLLSRLAGKADTIYSYTTIGRITNVNSFDNTVTMRKNGKNIRYPVSGNADIITRDGKYSIMGYLSTNMYVRLHVTDNIVVQIDIINSDSEDDKIFERIEGRLEDLNFNSFPNTVEILIDFSDEDADEVTFELKDDIRVYINGTQGILTGDLDGEDVAVYVRDNVIYELYIEQ